jgi:hypothetical protein
MTETKLNIHMLLPLDMYLSVVNTYIYKFYKIYMALSCKKLCVARNLATTHARQRSAGDKAGRFSLHALSAIPSSIDRARIDQRPHEIIPFAPRTRASS